MRAIVLPRIAPIEERPLQHVERPTPEPVDGQVLLKVSVCGLCHTDIDEIEGRLAPVHLPIIPGHQVVGTVAAVGPNVTRYNPGDRLGVTWLYASCGRCRFCRDDRENLCERAQWTGKDADGGYAEYMVVGQDYAHPIPPTFSDLEAAPLLCAGVIGYRAMQLVDILDGSPVGLFGFGASAHIVIQLIRHRFPRSDVFVFTRSHAHRDLARRLGAAWTGAPGDEPPAKVGRAIDFTPVGETIRTALSVLDRGGRLVINAIRKVDPIPPLAYHVYLWDEREITSVANVTRQDAIEFLSLAAEIPIRPTVQAVEPAYVSEALLQLKQGKVEAAAALQFA
jgi:propanol-preferring alcohol dehydrogenase